MDKKNAQDKALSDTIVRKISLDNKTLEKAIMMSSKYYAKSYLDKSIKPDEILSNIIKDAIDFAFENKFLKELNCNT